LGLGFRVSCFGFRLWVVPRNGRWQLRFQSFNN